MHKAGVNTRYLGKIANLTKLPHVRNLAITEMLAHTCSKILGQQIIDLTFESNGEKQVTDVGLENYTALSDFLQTRNLTLSWQQGLPVIHNFDTGMSRRSMIFRRTSLLEMVIERVSIDTALT